MCHLLVGTMMNHGVFLKCMLISDAGFSHFKPIEYKPLNEYTSSIDCLSLFIKVRKKKERKGKKRERKGEI